MEVAVIVPHHQLAKKDNSKSRNRDHATEIYELRICRRRLEFRRTAPEGLPAICFRISYVLCLELSGYVIDQVVIMAKLYRHASWGKLSIYARAEQPCGVLIAARHIPLSNTVIGRILAVDKFGR